MTDEEIERVIAAVCGDPAAGIQPSLTASQGIALLTAGGFEPPYAEGMVFSALGGCDLIVTGADGVDRYQYSGRAVEEVARQMERRG